MTDLPSIFHDITPIPQDDGPQPVCAIDYPLPYVEAMDYLRAVLRSDEHSERTLKLTEVCLKYNPANYTTWHFRRQCLASLSEVGRSTTDADTSSTYYNTDRVMYDLDLSARLGGSNPKNYQIWYHRRNLLEHSFSSLARHEGDQNNLGLVQKELDYVKSVFDIDAKNYHAWSHRQWIISTVDVESIWIEEIEYVKTLIKDDLRNNSAWNQRWFASHRSRRTPPLSLEKGREEVEYALECATLDPYNESPWTYMLAIIKEQFKRVSDSNDDDKKEVMDFIDGYQSKMLELKSNLEKLLKLDGNEFIHLSSTYINLLEMKEDNESLQVAANIADQLAIKYDTIRKKYWMMRKRNFLQKINEL